MISHYGFNTRIRRERTVSYLKSHSVPHQRPRAAATVHVTCARANVEIDLVDKLTEQTNRMIDCCVRTRLQRVYRKSPTDIKTDGKNNRAACLVKAWQQYDVLTVTWRHVYTRTYILNDIQPSTFTRPIMRRNVLLFVRNSCFHGENNIRDVEFSKR